MKQRWIGVLVFFVAMGVVVACASAPAAVGYTSPPDASARADGGADVDGDVSVEPGGGDDDASTFSPYLRGALAVQARGCPACHQSADEADGVLSGQSTPIPGTTIYGKNLTPDPETGIGGLTDSQILKMIRLGKDEDGNALCNVMPRFSDMSADEATSILVYLRALNPVHREIPDGECAWGQDGGDAGEADGGQCKNLVAPGEVGPCHACLHPPCQANGCFNGFMCDVTTSTCHPPPPGCE